jgi:hypothetical protein
MNDVMGSGVEFGKGMDLSYAYEGEQEGGRAPKEASRQQRDLSVHLP